MKPDIDKEWKEAKAREDCSWWAYEVFRNDKRITSCPGFGNEYMAMECGRNAFNKHSTKPSLKGGDWVLKIYGGFWGMRYKEEIQLS